MIYNFIRFPGGRGKCVTFSYDDGTGADVRLCDTFNKYRLKCTFNLVGSRVEKNSGLAKDYIVSEILGKGHEIATHGRFHKALGLVRPTDGIRDTLDSRLILEREFGGIIRGLAYPDRSINSDKNPELYQTVKTYLRDLGIAYARAAGGDNDSFDLPDDFFNWIPTAHHDNPQLFEYIDRFLNFDFGKVYRTSRTAKLLYIWGHAHEYQHNGNWDRLEAICEKTAGKDGIWYATNIEIYDYITAYNSLVYSADGATVFNPTLFEIWFDVDGKLYSVKSGQTLTIE